MGSSASAVSYRRSSPSDAGTPASPASPASTEAAPSAVEPAKPSRPATGYGYGDSARDAVTKRPAKARVAKARSQADPVNVATLPGFEMLPDGGSRLFVQMTGNPQVEEKKAAGSVTYVIKGVRIIRRNNRNALETAHFNTPVLRARLVPSGHDLHFVVDLRHNVAPQWKLTANSSIGAKPETAGANGARPEKASEASNGATTTLAVDFPKGDFLPAHVETPPPPEGKSRGTTPATPTAKATRGGTEVEPLPETVPEGEPPPRGSGPGL